jgi:hypothetical protein
MADREAAGGVEAIFFVFFSHMGSVILRQPEPPFVLDPLAQCDVAA